MELVSANNNSFAQQSFCSGHGQYHTNSPDKVTRRPYEAVTWQHIEAMTINPPSVNKSDARWTIFSNVCNEHARSANYQRQHGHFGALWVDIDEHTPKQQILNAITSLGCKAIIYTTSSATPDKQKWRAIVPLAVPVGGEQFELCQQVINDRFEAVGIIPDRKSETANQICYLPNRGQYYDHEILDGPLFNASVFDAEVTQIKEVEAARKAEAKQRREAKRIERIAQAANGAVDVMDFFNQSYDLEDLLDKYGYKQKGNRWLSPNSESGTPGVTINDDGLKWLSSHESDVGIGSEPTNGVVYGDAFDLYVHYEHKDDRIAALKAAGDNLTVLGGDGVEITLNQHNQQLYAQQNKPDVKAMFGDVAAQTTGNTSLSAKERLKMMSARGKSEQRRKQMLNDVYVFNRIAILGQATVIYAKPNLGKTVTAIRFIVDAIEDGRVDGENVFYINADDTFKGATTKLELAEKHGFHMLIPNENNFTIKDLIPIIQGLITDCDAKGQVIILDTLKKSVDLMDKKLASNFTSLIREFVGAGGTFIALAHTNKHLGADGQLIPQGTSDVVDDVDCVYVLGEISNQSGVKTVEFINIKSRGDVADRVSYTYTKQDGDDWMDIFNSIQCLDDETANKVKRKAKVEEQFEQDRDVVMVISQLLWNGKKMKKTELINMAHKNCMESADCNASKKKVIEVLERYDGFDRNKKHQWMSVPSDDNASVYSLLPVEEVSFL
ncbi:hypothetical protein [Thiomicrorhabdus xiamenensis]|uniref:AAA domain-containing protein n=1 Tax=Thiomicrorhabdus xiamenensis TaxID=2739063 RepID=A0A7D4SS12_9GAMM|nr:hypothetical protein [Thiomicrorhabdus xiamenensis]QKI88963.1 hypothetical protein HQN79_04945 [Thiomicrorhabdus xiamenensis]